MPFELERRAPDATALDWRVPRLPARDRSSQSWNGRIRRPRAHHRRRVPLHWAASWRASPSSRTITRENVHEWIRYDGLENFTARTRKGKGVLVATAHLGNWELSAFTHALMTAPMHIVVRPLDNRSR